MPGQELPPVVAGSIGGAFAAVCSYPFDTLKVRSQSGCPSSRLLHGISPTGIFKGVSTPIAMVAPQWAAIFWGYRVGSDAYGPDDGEWRWQRSVLGGWSAGVACSLVYCPLQAVKCTVQVQRCSPSEAVHLLWRFGGLRRGLYRGYLPALAYELPGFAVFFGVYDGVLARLAVADAAAGPGRGGEGAGGGEPQRPRPSLPCVVLAAALASLMESTVGMPGDTLRTRFQTDLSHPSVSACARVLYRDEGWRGFYRGYPFRLAFGIVVNASALAAIEVVNGLWGRLQGSASTT